MNCRCARSAISSACNSFWSGRSCCRCCCRRSTLMAWRGYRRRDAISILLSACVIVPFVYFLWKSLTLRIGDTWPMFLWPIGFAAAAINIAMLPRENWPAWMIKSTVAWAKLAVASGIVLVVGTFLYSVVIPWNFFGKADPIGGEAGYEQVASRARDEMQKIGASWIATTDYRTYAMLRWYLKDRVPVVQINERGRFLGFRDPGMNLIRGHTGLYVAREPDQTNPVWAATTAVRDAAGASRTKLARDGDGYLCAGETDRLDPRACAAAGFAAVSLARAGGERAEQASERLAFAIPKIRTLERSGAKWSIGVCDGAVVVRHGAAGIGCRLPRSRHKNDRAVRGRRRHRRAGAHHRAKSQQQMGPAGGGGKPAGRVRRDRHPRRDESAARWLYLADGVDRRADGGVVRRRRPVRRQQGARADRDRRSAAVSARGQPKAAGQLDRRSDPPRQRKAGRIDVRLFRRRRRVASVCRAVRERRRHQVAAHSLQGHRPRGDRPARRAHRPDVRARTRGAAVRAIGPT